MYISRYSVDYLYIVLNQSNTCWDRWRFRSYCERSSFEFGIGYFFFFNFTGFGLILYFFPPISGVALILSADDTITQCTTPALDQIFVCWFWLNFLFTLDLVCYFLLIFWRQNSIRLVVWTCFSKREFKKKKKRSEGLKLMSHYFVFQSYFTIISLYLKFKQSIWNAHYNLHIKMLLKKQIYIIWKICDLRIIRI